MSSTSHGINLSAAQEELLHRLLEMGKSGADAFAVRPVPRTGLVPASLAQQRLWFLEQHDGLSAAYSTPFALWLNGPLDLAALRAALGEVLKRHEILRTRLAVAGSDVIQVVAPATGPDIALIDLTGEPAAEDRAVAIMRSMANEAFQLAGEPLLRLALCTLADDHHCLFVNMHHSITDGWSEHLFFEELGALYTAHVTGAPAPLLPPRLQYADFALWEADQTAKGRYDTQLAYWRERLAGAPDTLDLPIDRTPPRRGSHAGAGVHCPIAPDLLGERATWTPEVSASTMTVAALAILLHGYTGARDLVIGTPVANRVRREWEDVLGQFVNTVALRITVPEDAALGDVVRGTRIALTEALAHQDAPFDKVVQAVGAHSESGRKPIFQVLCTVNETIQPPALHGLRTRVREVVPDAAKVELQLKVDIDTSALACTFEYATDLFDRGTIERMALDYADILTAVVAEPGRRVDTLDIARPRPRPAVHVEVVAAPADHGDAPVTVTEIALAEIWSEVLGTPEITRATHFFREGGGSLLATRAVLRIRQRWDIDATVQLLFEAPVLADLAELLDRLADQPPVGRQANPAPRAYGSEIPLSLEQERLWFLHQYDPADTSYNVVFAMEVVGEVDLGALDRAVRAIAERHELLRTTFHLIGDRPVQRIAPSANVALTLVDLTFRPEVERQAEARRLAHIDGATPFDLAKGPLLRTTAYRLDGARFLLVYVMHHIVIDDWSSQIMFRELAAAYTAQTAGIRPALPDVAAQFGEHVLSQRARLTDDVLDQQLAYWRSALAGAPLVLELPTDQPRPTTPSYTGAARFSTLSRELGDRLDALSRAADVTLYMTLLAAFQVLLMRHSGQRDLLVGTTMAGRSEACEEDIVGFFIKTLVMRGDLNGDPTFRELLARTRNVALGAYAHQDLPFDRLVRELRPDRAISHPPIFQVLFDFQTDEPDKFALGEHQVTRVDLAADTAHYDLSMAIIDTVDGLRVGMRYRDDLFSGATIERWLARWRILLESIADDPDQHIGTLALLPEDELAMLSEWRTTMRSSPNLPGVHAIVTAWAQRTPEAVALVHENTRLTYAQLDERANQLAGWLAEHGVGPETGVALYIERSVEAMVGILAVLKAGGYYVPLDVSHPASRIRDIVADVAPRLFLTQRRFAAALREILGERPGSIVELDALDVSARSTADPGFRPHPENLVYVLHTSGSTGRPKGVAMHHDALLRIVDWYATETGIAAGAHLLQFSSLGFDASFCEIFGGWHAGARVVLLPRDDLRQDAEALLDLLEREEIEHLEGPYSGLLNIAYWAGQHDRHRRLALRTIVTGGEQLLLAPDLVAWLKQLPGVAVRNGYGPSETSVATTYWLRGDPEDWPELAPIGRPITDADVYLLDGAMNPVPIGVTGEVYVGGDIVARGYLNRPGLTAARFVPDPFRPLGRRLYRTGDLARHRPDGVLEFLGRMDNQVKLRGYRIELGEIEACLHSHPDVAEAAVVVAENGGKHLVGYFVARDTARVPGNDQFKAYLGARLPDYMVPSAYVAVPAFPLTASGKLDRTALARSTAPSVVPIGSGTGESSSTETALLGIWRDLFSSDMIDVHDDFFDLGGHSLLATKAIARIRSALGVKVLLSQLFGFPTIAELAVEIGRNGRPVVAGPPISTKERKSAGAPARGWE